MYHNFFTSCKFRFKIELNQDWYEILVIALL